MMHGQVDKIIIVVLPILINKRNVYGKKEEQNSMQRETKQGESLYRFKRVSFSVHTSRKKNQVLKIQRRDS